MNSHSSIAAPSPGNKQNTQNLSEDFSPRLYQEPDILNFWDLAVSVKENILAVGTSSRTMGTDKHLIARSITGSSILPSVSRWQQVPLLGRSSPSLCLSLLLFNIQETCTVVCTYTSRTIIHTSCGERRCQLAVPLYPLYLDGEFNFLHRSFSSRATIAMFSTLRYPGHGIPCTMTSLPFSCPHLSSPCSTWCLSFLFLIFLPLPFPFNLQASTVLTCLPPTRRVSESTLGSTGRLPS